MVSFFGMPPFPVKDVDARLRAPQQGAAHCHDACGCGRRGAGNGRLTGSIDWIAACAQKPVASYLSMQAPCQRLQAGVDADCMEWRPVNQARPPD
jgi:hypothetical protein